MLTRALFSFAFINNSSGDMHETKYDSYEVYVDLTDFPDHHPLYYELPYHCRYSLRMYPSTTFEENLDSAIPEVFAAVVAATFALVAVVFFVYDMFVQRRNERLIANAAQSNAIVSSLFPSNIRDRLINNPEGRDALKAGDKSSRQLTNLKQVMSGDINQANEENNKPIADLFLDCTVLFADIAGFT